MAKFGADLNLSNFTMGPTADTSDAELLGAIGKTAIEAYRGYEDARLEGFMDSDTPESVTLAGVKEDPKTGIVTIEPDTDLNLNKIAAARKQGNISAAAAKILVQAAVKEASNRMPGRAAEYRKQAAAFFGDFGPGQDLLDTSTKQSDADKLKLQAEKLIQKGAYERYGAAGLDPRTGVATPEAALGVVLEKKAENELASLKRAQETVALKSARMSEVINSREATHRMSSFGAINVMLSQVRTLAKDPANDTKITSYRAEAEVRLNKYIQEINDRVDADIRAGRIKGSDGDAIKKRWAKDYTDALQVIRDVDGIKQLAQMFDLQQNQARSLEARIKLMAPGMTMLRTFGVIDATTFAQYNSNPDMLPAPIKEAFDDVFQTDKYKMLDTSMQGLADGTTSLSDMAKIDKNLSFVAKTQIYDILARGDIENPKVRQRFTSYFTAYTASIDPSSPKAMKEWIDMVGSPGFLEKFNSLTLVEKNKAVKGMADKVKASLATQDIGLLDRLAKVTTGEGRSLKISFSNGEFTVVPPKVWVSPTLVKEATEIATLINKQLDILETGSKLFSVMGSVEGSEGFLNRQGYFDSYEKQRAALSKPSKAVGDAGFKGIKSRFEGVDTHRREIYARDERTKKIIKQTKEETEKK